MKFLSQINVNTEYTLPMVDGTNGQVLSTDGAGVAYWGTISAGSLTLDGLSDVIITSPATGQILRYGIPVGSGEVNPVWHNVTPNFLTTSSSIDSLGDVTITTAATGQLLRYNGSAWVNWTPNFLTAEADTLQSVTSRGSSTSTDVSIGGVGGDRGLSIYHGSGVSDYGRIRFYQTSTNINTIHSFSTAWQSGNVLVSGGALNLTGNTGVTIGGWNDPDAVFRAGGGTYFRNSVGIGINNPQAPLDVNGNIYIRETGALYTNTIAGYSTNVVSIGASTNFIVPSGNVGIRTTTPQKFLDVNGSGIVASFGGGFSPGSFAGLHFGYSESYINSDNYKKSALVFERTDNHGQGGNASGKIHFLLNNIGSGSATSLAHSVMVIDTNSTATQGSARVGIGTTSPNATLDVNGAANATSFSSTALLITNADTSGSLQPGQGDPANKIYSFRWQGNEGGYIDTDNKITFSGFKTPAGTSSQFLKANGTVDSNTYITSTALNGYATQSWVNTNYYNRDQIDDFFGGAEAISGYNKSNWDAAYNDKINSATFSTTTGVLTLTQQDTGTVTVDLDGRYLESLPAHNHDDRYYTETESDSRYINASGDTMSGSLSFDAAAVIKKKITGVGDNPVKTASGVLASRSDNGGGYTYYVIETNVPQDDYQMGGFTIELFGRYGETNNKTKIDLGGYWNSEENGGFIGFEAHGTNPQYKPTIEVSRNSEGKTAFIIYGVSLSYPVIVARDLWLGYNNTDGSTYGEGWTIRGTNDVSSYTNKDTVVWRNAYSDSNPAGYITGYSETDTLSSVTGRGATTSTPITINGGGAQPLALTTANGSPWHIALVRNDLGLTSRVFAHNSPYNGWYFEHNISIAGNTNWHSGNLTNLNQLTNGPGYITGYTETDTLASVTARGASTSTNSVFTGGLQARKNQTANNYTTAALWTESYGNTTTGIAFHISGNVGKFLEMRTDGILYWEDRQVWTSGNLTNLNQLSNGPGYITGISFANVSSKPTTIAGYGITDAITTANIGSQSVAYAGEAGFVSNQGGQLLRFDNRTISPSETGAGYLQFGFTSWTNNNASPYADYLHMRSYTDSSGGSDNLVMFKKSGIGMRIWQQSWGSSTAYSSYADVWTTGDFTSSNVSSWNTAYGWGNHASVGYATEEFVNGQGYLTSLPAHTHTIANVTGLQTALDGKLSAEADTLATVTARGNVSTTGIRNEGGHHTTLYENVLPAANNGGGAGLVQMAWWVSEPGITWSNGGFGYNVINDGAAPYGFGRRNSSLGQAYMRMSTSGDWFFYNANTSGARVETMTLTSVGSVGIGTTSPGTKLHVDGVITATGGTSSNWNTAFGWGNHSGLYLGLNSKAADSELLDGVDESRFVYGNSNTRRGTNLISNWNQNNYPDVAFLSAENGATNAPSSDYTYGTQYSFHRSGAAYRTQLVTALYSDTSIYVRNSRDSDVWTSWKRLWHSGDFTSTDVSNWNTAYNDRISSAAVTGTTTKTLTLTQGDGGTVTASWTDYDTDNDAQQLTWSKPSITLSISNGNSIALEGLATEEFVTGQGYITGSYLPLSGGTLTGNLTFSTQGSKITFGDSTSTNPCMIGEGLVNTEGTDSDFLTIYARSSLRIYSTITTERARFDINGLTVNGTITEQSSIRYKKDVVGIESTSDRVELLKPVRYKKIENDAEEIGLIAEDVVELFPEVVKYDNEGRPDGVNYSRLSVILLKAVQELTERVNKLENK